MTLETRGFGITGVKQTSYVKVSWNAADKVLNWIFVLFLIAVVLLQSGKSAGLSGAIAGGADTFLSKNKAKTVDAKLAKWTKWVAIAFMLLTLSLSLIP